MQGRTYRGAGIVAPWRHPGTSGRVTDHDLRPKGGRSASAARHIRTQAQLSIVPDGSGDQVNNDGDCDMDDSSTTIPDERPWPVFTSCHRVLALEARMAFDAASRASEGYPGTCR